MFPDIYIIVHKDIVFRAQKRFRSAIGITLNVSRKIKINNNNKRFEIANDNRKTR